MLLFSFNIQSVWLWLAFESLNVPVAFFSGTALFTITFWGDGTVPYAVRRPLGRFVLGMWLA